MKSFYTLLLIHLVTGHFVFSQNVRSLSDYINNAHQNNPTLKENVNLQKFNLLQNDITTAQFKRPQVNITGDYLFAPFFFNYGKFISLTPNPDTKAIGYDAGLTNGGLYAAQLNVAAPLFRNGVLRTLNNQNIVQNQILQNNSNQLIHDLDKDVTDEYIASYQVQQQIGYLQKIIELINDRKKIVEALVLKGLMQQNDYLLLDIEISTLEYDLKQQQITHVIDFNQLNNTCGITDSTIYELSAPPVLQSEPLQQFHYKQKFRLDSLNIVSMQNIYNTKYKPQLSAFGNTGINAVEAANIPRNIGLSAGLHLNIPLYDGHQKRITEQQNKLLFENLQLYLQQSSIRQMNNLNSLQEQISMTRQSVNLLNSQLATQQTLLQILKDKVVNGQISVTDYLNAVQNFVTSNQNKIQAETNLLLLINQYNYVNW